MLLCIHNTKQNLNKHQQNVKDRIYPHYCDPGHSNNVWVFEDQELPKNFQILKVSEQRPVRDNTVSPNITFPATPTAGTLDCTPTISVEERGRQQIWFPNRK